MMQNDCKIYGRPGSGDRSSLFLQCTYLPPNSKISVDPPKTSIQKETKREPGLLFAYLSDIIVNLASNWVRHPYGSMC